MRMGVCPTCGAWDYEGVTCSRCGTLIASRDAVSTGAAPARTSRAVTLGTGPASRGVGKTRKTLAGIAGALFVVVVIPALIFAIIYGIDRGHVSSGHEGSGQTSLAYQQPLTDVQSASALLQLIASRPSYDAYVVDYPDAVSGQTQEFGYVFSSDTVIWIYTQPNGTPFTDTWKGHGIQRITRESEGGTLDD